VYVYSEPGHGTIFKLYFPAHVGAAEIDQATANVPVQEVGPLSVLLVEDDPAVRDAMRAVLESLGHEVQSASTATDALDVIQVCAADFDVVLTDAVMPGMSGLALAERLSQEHPDLPVVLMSGYSEEAVSGGRVLPPGVVFVEKPFTAQIISQAFRDVGAYAAADA
jgi:CheY-like chemotaxis protein